MTEWHAWADTDHVIEVVKSMSLPDQEVLRLITCMDDLDIESLASILEIDAADARATFERVTSTFRAIYAATDPDPGSLNSIGGES
ncbi:MAG: hypothetical protein JWM34_1081 [Ilumatobacteraceae bacterium]|nr:hypothetical protein [Ilumatobacteraceae bacterium]